MSLANISFCELKRKEVINLRDGARLGAVCDMEIDRCTGTVCSIVVPGPPKLWGLLKSDEELVIPFCKISKIGDDVILVDLVL
jgi:YlmC/YmxH family sporulation protein